MHRAIPQYHQPPPPKTPSNQHSPTSYQPQVLVENQAEARYDGIRFEVR